MSGAQFLARWVALNCVNKAKLKSPEVKAICVCILKPSQGLREANQRPALDAAGTFCLHSEGRWRRASRASAVHFMKHAKESDLKWVEQRSPRGRFHLLRRHIS